MGIKDLFGRTRSEYHLENVIEQSRIFPRTFLLPPQNEIHNLQVGSLVKLIFVFEKTLKNGCNAERMWVRITDTQNGSFIGIVDNDPYFLKTIKSGDEVKFDQSNIASIYTASSAVNEELFAIITKKALENRQINWVIRSDDLNNPQDSGWQLFYGDESESYMNDVNNASIVSLENVLSFEPLLEEVFCGAGNAYEYSKELNKFIEVKN